MKKLGTVVAFPFIYLILIYYGVFILKQVLSDSLDSNGSTMEIKPTVMASEDILSNTEPKSAVPFDENDIVESTERRPIENVDKIQSSDHLEEFSKTDFPETLVAQNSGVVREIANDDTPPVVALAEEPPERADLASSVISGEENLSRDDGLQSGRNHSTVGKANASDSTITEPRETRSDLNITASGNRTAEEIPSFSEWAQKHLEEAEKKEQVNFSAPNQTAPGSGAKLRWKNYASLDCGAKVIQANPEAQNTWAVLSPSRDEYKLDPCNSRIWFVVELCEAIQVKRVDLANYELFSSSPKEFVVSVGDRFPTRDWSIVGQFTAKDERDVQSFDMNHDTFGKYVKVEIKSHYGSEHYCPLSLFRAYGTSVFEVLQKDDPAHEQHPVEEDDEDDAPDGGGGGDSSGNLLSSATDAVLSMVKKAAQVLGNKVNRTLNESNSAAGDGATRHRPTPVVIKSCTSPSHCVVCDNCSDVLFGEIFELLSCKQAEVAALANSPFIRRELVRSNACGRFGFDFLNGTVPRSACPGFLDSFFPPRYLGAMCNTLAVTYNKVLYNVTRYNVTEAVPAQDAWIRQNIDAHEENPSLPAKTDTEERSPDPNGVPTAPLLTEGLDVSSKPVCLTDTVSVDSPTPPPSPATANSEINSVPVAPESVPSVPDAKKVDGKGGEHGPEPGKPADASAVDPGLTEGSTESLLFAEGSVEENIDKLMTEMGNEGGHTVVNAPTGGGNVQGQKESVFLRLSNRIKTLERNMSLSGQYLEELSKRYKRQVEEMQRLLEKTVQTLNEITKKQDERNGQLETRIQTLTHAVEALSAERNSWKSTCYWLFVALTFTFLGYCFNRYSPRGPSRIDNAKPVQVQPVDTVTPRAAPKKKKRRPSDQALKIVATAPGDQEKPARKRKKKSSDPTDYRVGENFSPKCTSSKIWPSKSPNPDWVEERALVEDVPFVLDDSDNSTLDSLPVPREMDEAVPPAFVKTATDVRLGRCAVRNGAVSNEVNRRRPSPVLSVNGSVSSGNEQTPKKEKRGFKKLFKKVF